jgi:hypothetical protein
MMNTSKDTTLSTTHHKSADLVVYGFAEKKSETQTIDFSVDNMSCTKKEYVEKFATANKIFFMNSCCNKLYRSNLVKQTVLVDEKVRLGKMLYLIKDICPVVQTLLSIRRYTMSIIISGGGH